MTTITEAALQTGRSASPRAARGLRPVTRRISRMHEIAKILRRSIIAGELKPGLLYSVGALAEVLEVSRTPVREALIELAGRGLVQFERNRGVRILVPSADDIEQIYEIREMLEVPLMPKVVENVTPTAMDQLRTVIRRMDEAAQQHDKLAEWELDREFHYLLVSESGNLRVADYLDELWDQILVRSALVTGLDHHPNAVCSDHGQILDAVASGDIPRAKAAVNAHLEASRAIFAQ